MIADHGATRRPIQASNRHHSEERGGHAAKSNSPRVSHTGRDDAGHGRETQADEQWCDDGDGHAESGDALEERGEHPAQNEELHGAVGGQAGDAHADDFQRAGLAHDVVQGPAQTR